MMLNLTDEDDDEFTVRPETSSKLANLFGADDNHLDEDSANNSLTYTAPKQPKKLVIGGNAGGDSAANTSSVMSLIHASVVTVFKFDRASDQYQAQGKLGAALLANHDTRTYKLIIYSGNQKHIAYASIGGYFELICQPNNYMNFYDDNRQNWSVMFATEEEKLNFSRQLTVCKFNAMAKTAESETTILTQDLMTGDRTGDPIVAEDNDNIELRYKGWMFEENQTVGKLFASVDGSAKKPFRLKLVGKWTQMLRGMSIGSKRFAVFTPTMRQQLTGILESAPLSDNCRYGLQFELVKIQPRGQHKKADTKSVNEINEQKPSIVSEISSEQRSHSNSVNDEDRHKSDILSRVTRMGGLPILPVKPVEPKPSDRKPSDPKPPEVKLVAADTTDTSEEDLQSRPVAKARNNSFTSTVSQSNESQNTLSSYSTQPVQYVPQTIDSNLAILTHESRTNQTEIRMNLNKILDKIDLVSEKVSEMKCSPIGQSIGFMDSTILLSSIQRIVNENNQLKKEVEEKTSSLQTLNEKIVDLLRIQTTGGQNGSELDRLRQSETELRREVSQLNDCCHRLTAQSDHLRVDNSRLKETIDDLRAQIHNFDRELSPRQSRDSKSQIKRLMNDVFRRISAQMDENHSYRSDEVLDIVSEAIRSATLAVIESDKDMSSRTSSPYRRSVDEIDKRDKETESERRSDPKAKEAEKPVIPQRKSIEQKSKTDNESDN